MKFIKDISRSILSFFKTIGRYLKASFLYIYNILKKITLTIVSFVKAIGIFIWKNFLVYIYLFFKKIFTVIYVFFATIIVFTWSRALKPFFVFIGKNAFIPIKFISLNIYKFMKFVGRNIWRFIVFIASCIKSAAVYIFRLFVKMIDFLWAHFFIHIINLFKKIFTFLGYLLKPFKLFFSYLWKIIVKIYYAIKDFFTYGLKILPDSLYLLITDFGRYFVLIIHFIYVLFSTIIKYTIVLLIKNIYKFFRFIFIRIKNFLRPKWLYIMNHLRKFLRILLFPLNRVIDLFLDLLKNSYIIIFLPIITPIFIVLSVLSIIKSLLIYLLIIFKTLFNLPHFSHHLLIKIKPLYLPSINIFKNSFAYLVDLKINYYLNTRAKSLWYLVEMINWSVFFNFILSTIISIVFLPVTIVSSIFYLLVYINDYKNNFEAFIKDRITIKETSLPGYFYQPQLKIFNRKVSYDLNSDALLSNLKNFYLCGEDTLTITPKIDNVLLTKQSFKNSTTTKYLLLKSMNYLTNEILNDKNFDGTLPSISDDDLVLTYEKKHFRDRFIEQNKLLLRNNVKKTSLTISLFSKSSRIILEHDITIKYTPWNVIMEKMNFENHVFRINNNDNFKIFLDKRLSFQFIPSDIINESGKITVANDDYYEIKFFLTNQIETIYTARIYVYMKSSQLSYYLKQIKKPFINLDEKSITYQEHLINPDQSERFLLSYFNNEKLDSSYLSSYDLYIGNIKHYLITYYFEFNNTRFKVIKKLRNPYNSKAFHYDYYLMLLDKSLPYITATHSFPFNVAYINKYYVSRLENIESNRFIYLPMIDNSYVRLVRWKSLSPKLITSAGRLKSNSSEVVIFKVTLYHNLLNRKTITISINKSY
ncbi:MAG: hypothetical protein RBQ97_07005 [Acholeplasma sp.]|nr:hypothetical protein [Acholeplasma sp.]